MQKYRIFCLKVFAENLMRKKSEENEQSLEDLSSGHRRSRGRRSGLMVSALDSGSSGPGSRPGRGHCVVFMGKTLDSHSASLHPGV